MDARPHMVGTLRMVCGGFEFWQVFPEKLAAIEYTTAAHMKQVDRQHPILKVIPEHVGVITFGCGNTLLFLQLLDG